MGSSSSRGCEAQIDLFLLSDICWQGDLHSKKKKEYSLVKKLEVRNDLRGFQFGRVLILERSNFEGS